jgi:hypothetical protein
LRREEHEIAGGICTDLLFRQNEPSEQKSNPAPFCHSVQTPFTAEARFDSVFGMELFQFAREGVNVLVPKIPDAAGVSGSDFGMNEPACPLRASAQQASTATVTAGLEPGQDCAMLLTGSARARHRET